MTQPHWLVIRRVSGNEIPESWIVTQRSALREIYRPLAGRSRTMFKPLDLTTPTSKLVDVTGSVLSFNIDGTPILPKLTEAHWLLPGQLKEILSHLDRLQDYFPEALERLMNEVLFNPDYWDQKLARERFLLTWYVPGQNP